MPSIILYLLKCSISLAIVWLFYQLLLRRLTFYTINRWFLLGYAFLSFLLPLVHIVLPGEGVVAGKVQMMSYIPVISTHPAVEAEIFAGWNILLGVLALGALLSMGRLLMRYLSLRRIRKEATLVQDAAVAIYQVDKPIIPFSFGNAIYVNAHLHNEKEWEEIILHEYVHVRQRHTVDILLAELLCIVTWFNPFSWLIRHAIRQNLEFIADQQVLAGGLDRKSYQYHLLKVIGEPCYRLANNFNFSSLKKRIIMMNKSKSARLHLVKFLFIVPMLGVLLAAFRDKVSVRGSLPVAVRAMDTTPVKSPAVIMRKVGMPDSVKPIIVIDEVESEDGLKKINSNDIASINVLKTAPGIGPRGANGVVLVYRKGYVKKNVIRLKDNTMVPIEVISVDVQTNASPVKIDTVPLKLKDLGKVQLDTLQLGDVVQEVTIDSVRIGNDVYNGRITGVSVKDAEKAEVKEDDVQQQLRNCLFIVDGVEKSREEAFSIKPERIESIQVLKDKSAVAIYGSKGKNGAVMIKTKSPGFTGQVSLTFVAEKNTLTMLTDTIHFNMLAPAKPANK